RRRKKRPRKPFAIMALDIEAARQIVEIPKEVEEILTGYIKPIVLLPRKWGSPVSDFVAPSLQNLGVMLAYTPLHYLLLRETRDKFLVMTSGNVHGDPMISDDHRMGELCEIADYILTHNRKIVHRVDDSVVRPTHGRVVILRFGRGYAPGMIKLKHNLARRVIAYGAELETGGAVGFDDKIILTPYSGDTDNPAVLRDHESTLDFLSKCYGMDEGEIVVSADLHPAYRSRVAAERFSSKNGYGLQLIQHHFAHMASVMAEVSHDPSEPAIGIMMDGAGYGLDGAIWGGEVITWDGDGFHRRGFIEYSIMPGGDLAVMKPARMLASLLSKIMDDSEVMDFYRRRGLLKGLKYGERELQAVLEMVGKGRGPRTSSTGRLLDSVSVLLSLCLERSYEGEPAIILENTSIGGKPLSSTIDHLIRDDGGKKVISSGELVRFIVENINESRRDLAYTAQYLLGACFGHIAGELAKEMGVKVLYVSGGAAVNHALLKGIEESSNMKIHVNRIIPPGDGGIAVGQAYITGKLSAGNRECIGEMLMRI
ncbi:MAG: Sua5/YciO/YrdC/YwlC family protein, partial [Nitrososphaeria archaeon]|nr:Sua5/YciO/YrdC/YwlC family protein [Nitrososphaeria archaeon]